MYMQLQLAPLLPDLACTACHAKWVSYREVHTLSSVHYSLIIVNHNTRTKQAPAAQMRRSQSKQIIPPHRCPLRPALSAPTHRLGPGMTPLCTADAPSVLEPLDPISTSLPMRSNALPYPNPKPVSMVLRNALRKMMHVQAMQRVWMAWVASTVCHEVRSGSGERRTLRQRRILTMQAATVLVGGTGA